MPLRDHFRPPPGDFWQWNSFLTMWVAAVAGTWNRTRSGGEFSALVNVFQGSDLDAAVADRATSPATPVATIDACFAETFAVVIQDRDSFFRPAGVVEFVAPSHKSSIPQQEAFVAKCLSYLRQSVGLVIVDVVTECSGVGPFSQAHGANPLANLHNALLGRLGATDATLPAGCQYVAGYRPVRRDGRNVIDLWPCPARVGDPIPGVPLGLRGGPVVPLDLEGTYTQALADSGL